jgi:hypothetical protein
MKLLALLVVSLAAVTASADVSVMDNNKTLTVDCAKDKNVNLVGNHITVTLTGTCDRVTATGNHGTIVGSSTAAYVAGNHNTLNLDGVDTISVPGNHNTVTYKRPLAKKKTAINAPGNGNTITRVK